MLKCAFEWKKVLIQFTNCITLVLNCFIVKLFYCFIVKLLNC